MTIYYYWTIFKMFSLFFGYRLPLKNVISHTQWVNPSNGQLFSMKISFVSNVNRMSKFMRNELDFCETKSYWKNSWVGILGSIDRLLKEYVLWLIKWFCFSWTMSDRSLGFSIIFPWFWICSISFQFWLSINKINWFMLSSGNPLTKSTGLYSVAAWIHYFSLERHKIIVQEYFT